MVHLVFVGCSKVSAHAAVVAGNNDTALASGLSIIDAVLGVDTSLLAGVLEDVGVLVLTDTANVESRVIRKDVL